MTATDHKKYGAYPAYQLDDMMFCTICAFKCTAIGFLLAGEKMPPNMEDAIAGLVLSLVEQGRDVTIPAGVPHPSGVCGGSCGADLAEIAQQYQEETK